MTQSIELKAEIPPYLAGERIDHALALLFPEHSRSRLKNWIEQGHVRVAGEVPRPRDKVKGGEWVEILASLEVDSRWDAEALPLEIVFQDEHMLVINKSNDMVVHPAAGHRGGTLVNALLHHVPGLSKLPRAGIVHRLDKNTSGLLVVAKTLEAHTVLVSALQSRTVERVYEAVVQGVLPSGGTISAPIGRHPHDRKRMSIQENGKEAITHYRVLQKFRAHSHLQLKLETGRTHQIRVHMAHLNYPILGDRTYGGRLRLPPNSRPEFLEMIRSFPRQALHAKKLGLVHPFTHEPMSFEIDLPNDMQQLLQALKLDVDANANARKSDY